MKPSVDKGMVEVNAFFFITVWYLINQAWLIVSNLAIGRLSVLT